MRSDSSLPYLCADLKLFSSRQQLEASKNEFRSRINSDTSKSQQEDRKSQRPLIHFTENSEGFTSFRSINSTRID